ncbi:extensin-like [Homalodisca vitripennis]|uniref:extensin-like n=1 Tax=Homalodisca vitripennis TaxID=197043 RepID=UPI001EEC43B2|nr:extensin-like [Homalodisca vitripennis]
MYKFRRHAFTTSQSTHTIQFTSVQPSILPPPTFSCQVHTSHPINSPNHHGKISGPSKVRPPQDMSHHITRAQLKVSYPMGSKSKCLQPFPPPTHQNIIPKVSSKSPPKPMSPQMSMIAPPNCQPITKSLPPPSDPTQQAIPPHSLSTPTHQQGKSTLKQVQFISTNNQPT